MLRKNNLVFSYGFIVCTEIFHLTAKLFVFIFSELRRAIVRTKEKR